VQRRQKRLPPVAHAFKQFLLRDGARLINEVVPVPTRYLRGTTGRRTAVRRAPA
jgi:hypothetical protein